MVAKSWALSVALALAFAGCAERSGEDPDNPGAGDDAGPSPGGSDRPGTANGNGTAAVPTWVVGDWWSWEVASYRLPGPLAVTTVVRSADGSSYEVGTNDLGQAGRVYPFHVVGLGTVDAATLAWEAHGLPVDFLRFPLQDGMSWTTDMWSVEGAEVSVSATAVQAPDGPVPGYRINMTYPGAPESIVVAASYAPNLGQFVEVSTYFGRPEPFATATLVESGTNFTGETVGFVARDIVRWSANTGSPPGSAQPQAFTATDEDHIFVFACFLPGAHGVYHVRIMYNDGSFQECQASNPAGAGQDSYVAVTHQSSPGQGAIVAGPLGQAGVNVELFGVRTS